MAQILSIRGFADSDDFTHHSAACSWMRDLSSVTVDRGPGDATAIGDATFGGTVASRSIAPSMTASASRNATLGYFATRTGGLLLDSGKDVEAAPSDGALDGARNGGSPCSASSPCRSADRQR